MKKIFSSKFLILIIPLFILSCNKAEKPIVLAENVAPLSSLTIIAHEKGFFKQEGLNVEIKPFSSGKLALDAVLGNTADIATVAETPLVFAAMKKQTFHIIATTLYSENGCKVIARADRNIKTAKDLKNKKIATLVGSNGEYFLDKLLDTNGINANTANKINLAPTDMVLALEKGEIDAFSVWEPYIAKAKLGLKDRSIIIQAPGLYTTTFNLVISNEFYKNFSNEQGIRFIKALILAEDFIKKNPQEAIKTIANYTKLDGGLLSSVWHEYDINLSLDENRLTGYLKQQRQWATGKNPSSLHIRDSIDYHYIFDPRYIHAVDETRIK